MPEKQYIVDPVTGDRYCVGGCIISSQPSDLPKFGVTRTLSNKHLPRSVDLRQLMTPVESQGQLNSCVGNAVAGAYEFLMMKNLKKHIDMSRLFIYYVSRKKDTPSSNHLVDGGTTIRSAIAALTEYGCCKEQSLPYNPAYVNHQPPAHCYMEAKNYRISEAMNVQLDLNEMKACLAEGFPFVFGLQIFNSFATAGSNGGRVPIPEPYYESQAVQHGWHAMLAVGYSDPSQCFLVRNSWGEDWGDKGYCYIPYTYMCTPAHCQDLHAIKIVENGQYKHNDIDILNPYHWSIDSNKKFFIPTDYLHHDIGYKFFWKLDDTFNYFNSVWNNTQLENFQWNKIFPKTHSQPKKLAIQNAQTKSFVLWIDKKTHEQAQIEQKMDNQHIHFNFCETMSKAEHHLLTHAKKIKTSSSFQIICRGYYKDENKNPLDLLKFLHHHHLHRVPVTVFTQDIDGLKMHLQHQASSMDVHDWKRWLFITNSSQELINHMKQNITEYIDTKASPMSNSIRRIAEFSRRSARSVKNINLFPSVPPSVDAHDLQNERIATVLFLSLFLLSIIVLFQYNSHLTVMQTDTFATPTFEQYQQLNSTHSQTLTCPCKHTSIDYHHFLRIEYTLHQVCTSVFVSSQWIEYLYHSHDNKNVFVEDFRKSGIHSFQALSTLCELINRTISESLIQLRSNKYISTSATSSNLFDSQIRTLIDQFRSSVTNSFLHSLNIIRSTTQSNSLYSTMKTNYNFDLSISSVQIGNCSCVTTSTCIQPFAIYNYSNAEPLVLIDHFYRGCYTMEALLQSTLEFWYNQTCLELLQSNIRSSSSQWSLTALDSSKSIHYFSNSTVQDLLDELMIEIWNASIVYEKYYMQCQPQECIYIYKQKYGLFRTITVFLGLLGGLTVVLAGVIPLTVKLVRRKRRVATVENETSIVRLNPGYFQRLIIHLRALNFFPSTPPSTDEYDLQNQRISTRLFILLVILSFTVLCICNSLSATIETNTIEAPTRKRYDHLYATYAQTLSCACKQIGIDYRKFIHVNHTSHQICTSQFVTPEWIHHINMFGNDTVVVEDIEYSGTYIFQALRMICQLVNRTISDSLSQFFSQQYISTSVIPSQLLQSQIQTNFEQVRLSTTNNFLLALDTVRSTTQANTLLSALLTNYQPPITIDNATVEFNPRYYGNCSCAITPTCVTEFSTYANANKTSVITVPGLYRGCYVFEALRQSTLECLFNETCVRQFHSINVTALHLSLPTKYRVNSTVEQLLKELMIEHWNLSVIYEYYYDSCQPIRCSYIYTAKHGVVYLITTLMALIGGLAVVWKAIVPVVIKLIRRRRPMLNEGFDVHQRTQVAILRQEVINFLRIFHLFPLTTPLDNRQRNRNEQKFIKVLVYLLVLLLTVLLLYNSLSTVMEPVSVTTPTFEQYQQLNSTHSQTLTCPCKHTSIDYHHFLRIEYTLHQVCTSVFVSSQWIEYLYHSHDNKNVFVEDFRKSGIHSFQALSTLCELINRTISESLIQLRSNNYVSTSMTSFSLFQSQIDSFVSQHRLSTTQSFLLSFDLIRNTTQSNTLLSASSTNYAFHYPNTSSSSILHSKSYSNCTCEINPTCVQSSSVYNSSGQFLIPGFYYGCYTIEALLQSTLECFFNEICISKILSYINPAPSISIATLSSTWSSRYSTNTTIQQLLNSLMIEQWQLVTKYEDYYAQCQPTECIYTYARTSNAIFIATTLLALFGGLITFLKIVIPVLVKFIEWINRRSRRRQRIQRVVIVSDE
ncbi:unnamed protein product [Adineta ricciae]|uniref:Peptidase C1A papain C-terminal domain-containing protein n=1 Tax=Adineta ricciae TaxID=249248 RepID=A0A814YFC4_ADIRI|nr:unnamed protein product [Adineta ricciae]